MNSETNTIRVYTIPLLPVWSRMAGVPMLIAGAIASVARFYFGYKPEYLYAKVFAVCTSFLETKYFTIILNNLSEELAGILIIAGLFLTAFSREKDETKIGSERLNPVRFRSFIEAAYINTALLAVAMFTLYGVAFIAALMANMFSILLIYVIIFRMRLSKLRKLINAGDTGSDYS